MSHMCFVLVKKLRIIVKFIARKRNLMISFFSFAAKGSRPCTQECCESPTVKGEPDSANHNYQMTWGWLMNILILAHIFSSLLLSPLSMPSLSISNAVSPGFLSSESRIKRRRSLQFSIENSSKDVRWNTEEPITQEIQTSSTLRENSAQR